MKLYIDNEAGGKIVQVSSKILRVEKRTSQNIAKDRDYIFYSHIYKYITEGNHKFATMIWWHVSHA